jgi:hypothetical protein
MSEWRQWKQKRERSYREWFVGGVWVFASTASTPKLKSHPGV